jgi:hypothetical protein
MMTNDAQPAGMNADDFFVIGPDLREAVDVGTFKRVVESAFGLVDRCKHCRHAKRQ